MNKLIVGALTFGLLAVKDPVMGSGVRMSEVAGEAESRTLQHLSDSCKIRHVLVNLNEYRAQAVVARIICE